MDGELLQREQTQKTNPVIELQDSTQLYSGFQMEYEALRWQAGHVCRDAGVDCKGEHVFRYAFATNCYHKGVNVKNLSRLLGRADVNITYNVYVHLYGDGFDEMYSALVSEK